MSDMNSTERLILHFKNNRAGEDVFRFTDERISTAIERHKDISDRIEIRVDWDLDNFEKSMRDADALVTWDLPTENLAERAPALRWIHIIGAGVEHLCPLTWLPERTVLTNNRGIHAEKTAESAAMAVLMLHNRIPAYVTDQRAARWNPVFVPPVSGKTVAVIGVGEMGGAAARSFKALGLRVLGIRRGGVPHPAVDRMYAPEGLHRVLAEADFVHITLPHTPETRGLIDKAAIRAMKAGAGLINFGRALVLDHAALAEALRDGHLGGAFLDVHDREPLPGDSPLWDVPNLILTPHVTSDDDTSYTPATLDLVMENCRRLLKREDLKNIVNPTLGY
ncbi:D-2-hydroxyacid dehydrogenase [Nisaea acidiphila]|uniref:D-2-hydroxyacid dehydrogenase n=1 Tax=Nisaea acidiphila TaxID=1862145 RepID=A0A9J7AYP9_9PROT|nr:D-2-hydroxyacid dehydrogenase [Nisaea acidiphila]UUX51914.1 D-2-hydroxyacid dehydrogenase [Nisaea acidiphila]